MLVTSFGFSLEAGNNKVSLPDLFASMRASNGIPDTTKASERRFYVDDTTDSDFFLGLVVTVKDQKRFLELVDSHGNFTVKVNNLHGTNKLMEFNFFVVNKVNGLGIYQYYHQSCSPGTFFSYLKSRYRALSESSRDSAIALLHTSGKHTRKAEAAIRSEHRQGLGTGLLQRCDSLGDVLKEFKEIRSFDYELVSIEPVVAEAQPLSGLVRRLKQRASFDLNVGKNAIAAGIEAMISRVNPRTARVHVIDDDDVPMSIRIASIPENFGEQEYDEIASDMNNLDVATFSTHAIIEKLLSTCKIDHDHLFMATVE